MASTIQKSRWFGKIIAKFPTLAKAELFAQQAFWQRAIPVILVVLSFDAIAQFQWFQKNFPFVHSGQLWFHRVLCSLVPRPVSAKWVKAVEIGDDLHQKLGEPTNRDFLAALIKKAVSGDAAVIVLDFKLLAPNGFRQGRDSPERSKQNANLLNAIREASNRGVPVVLACWLQENSSGDFERKPDIFSDADLPLPEETGECRRKACVRLGNINMPLDERKLPLVTPMQDKDPCSQSLSLATAAAYEDAIDRKPRTRDKGMIHSAIRDKHFVFSSFIKQTDFQTVKTEALERGEAEAVNSCRGRILVIGGNWHADLGHGALVDNYDTPVGSMQGMYIQANYIEALLDDRYQKEVPLWIGFSFDLVIAGALYHFFHRASSRGGKIFVLVVFLFPLAASYIVFANLNLYLDFILPLSACFVHLIVELVRDYIRLARLPKAASLPEREIG
jgi:CHASE2 domain-containing sensor protein